MIYYPGDREPRSQGKPGSLALEPRGPRILSIAFLSNRLRYSPISHPSDWRFSAFPFSGIFFRFEALT